MEEVERNQERIERLAAHARDLDCAIAHAEGQARLDEMRTEVDETTEQVRLVEERISSVKNLTHDLSEAVQRLKSESKSESDAKKCEAIERQVILKTHIEAQLYLNLRFAT